MKRRTTGFLIIILISALLVWLYSSSEGYIPHAGYILLYTGIGLITGIGFWLTTDSSATVDIKSLGIKLGGGVAVGVAFILVINHFIVPTENYKIMDLPEEFHDSSFSITGHDDHIKLTWISEQRLLIEFYNNTEIGTFDGIKYDADLKGFKTYEFVAKTSGSPLDYSLKDE